MFHALALFCLCWWRLTDVFGESVTEGDSVTFHTDTGIQKDDDILWKYGAEKSVIAQISRGEEIFPDVRFKDRATLDKQTGSLTITDLKAEHAGVYELKISGAKRSTKQFTVSVYDRLPVPDLFRNSSLFSFQSDCLVLCSVVNVRAVSLSWYKGNSLLSSISVSDLSISLSLPLEVEYQDTNTYSCVVNNTISNQTTHLDINHTCSVLPLLILLISVAGFLFIVTVIVICYICCKFRKTDEKNITHKPKKEDAVYRNFRRK